jgi:hypothetical protein
MMFVENYLVVVCYDDDQIRIVLPAGIMWTCDNIWALKTIAV